MRYLVRAGIGLGDTIVASPLVETLNARGDDVWFWVEPRFRFLFERAPFKVIDKYPKHVKFDFFVNFYIKDFDEVEAKVRIDCNENWWGLDTHEYPAHLFMNKMGVGGHAVKPKLYPDICIAPKTKVTIGFNNQSNWSMKSLSCEIERDLVESLFEEYYGIEVVYFHMSEGDFSGSSPLDERVRVLDCSLVEMVEEISNFDLMISVDTGPMHLAAALGIPTVAIFGPSDWRTWRPLGAPVTVLTSNPAQCERCLKQQRALGSATKCVMDSNCMGNFVVDRMMSEIKRFAGEHTNL